MSKEDARLVESVLQGQVDAFGLLVDKYAEMLFKYFTVGLGGGDQRIEDLCQETLIAGYTGLSSLGNKENFKGWLFGIASNKIKTAYREGRRDRTAAAELTNEEKLREDELETEIDTARIAVLVRKGLDRLPDEMREVVAMKYFGSLSYEEIALALDVPKSTVRGRLYRAYQMLRDIFGREG